MLFHKRYFKKFISYYQPYRWLFAADLLCALAVTAASLALPLCTRYITKQLLPQGGAEVKTEILTIGAWMLGLIAIQTACALFYDHMGHVMGARIERDMRNDLFAHMLRLPLRFFDREKTGALMSRITNDLLNIAELCHHDPENVMLYLISFVGAVIILFFINVRLAVVTVAFVPVMFLYTMLFFGKLKRCYRKSYETIAEMNAMVEDTLSGIRVVKSFSAELAESARFAAANEEYCQSRSDIYKNEARHYSVMEYLFVPLVTVAAVVTGGIWIADGALDLSDLMTFLLYIAYLTAPMPKIAQMIQQYQDGMAGFTRFMEILDYEPEKIVPEGNGNRTAAQGRIALEQVRFSYGNGAPAVLREFSLNIQAGETVAFVGLSGVGKTTLCALIPLFYPVEQGRILLDGRDIREQPLAYLRQNIGMVQQEVYLFSGTIMENPSVLIFDEATSALDYETEKKIQQSLAELSKDRTTLIVAHRLSTVRHADRIVVLTEGGVAEQGTHQELLEQNGLYAGLNRI